MCNSYEIFSLWAVPWPTNVSNLGGFTRVVLKSEGLNLEVHFPRNFQHPLAVKLCVSFMGVKMVKTSSITKFGGPWTLHTIVGRKSLMFFLFVTLLNG